MNQKLTTLLGVVEELLNDIERTTLGDVTVRVDSDSLDVKAVYFLEGHARVELATYDGHRPDEFYVNGDNVERVDWCVVKSSDLSKLLDTFRSMKEAVSQIPSYPSITPDLIREVLDSDETINFIAARLSMQRTGD